jgi:hypothetical protein
MATVFSSGWEGSGILDSSTWTAESGSGGLSVATDQHHQGSQALNFSAGVTAAFDSVYKTITAINTCCIRIAVRVNDISSGYDNYIVDLAAVSGHILCMVGIYYDKYIRGYRRSNATTWELVGTPFPISYDTWYQVELKYINSSTVSWKVWDAAGTTLLQSEQVGAASFFSESVTYLEVGQRNGSGSKAIYWLDSFIADDANYPGPLITSVHHPFPCFNPTA